MGLDQLLGDVPKSKFIDEFFLRLPFALPHGAAALVELATWDTLGEIFEQPEPDVMIVKDGRRWTGAAVPAFNEARQLFDDGYTLLVRHAERQAPRLAALAREFEAEFWAPVDVHVYCTPGGGHGFGWHYDAEDVFILQTVGSKEYSLRKNTVNPWPVVDTLPHDMQYEREIMPLMECLLDAGDWLYIPNGYWHLAEARSDSISIALGVMSTTALDAFDFARRRLLSSMLWRQRLPVPGCSSEDEQVHALRELFAGLGDDLARMFQDEGFLRSFRTSRQVIAHDVGGMP